MKTISVSIVSLIMLLSVVASAQKKATIQFQDKVYDYGLIKENSGPAKSVFKFVNIGNDTLKLTGVRTSCGCTASNYTKGPIAPGASGEIEAVYNPAGRPGPFSKSITVTSNDPDNSSITLIIKGEVQPKPRTVADNYPNKIGNLFFVNNHKSFNDIKDSEIKTDTFRLYNNGKAPMKISFKNTPSFLKLEILDSIMKPEMESMIIVTYDAKERKDYGYVFDKFYLNTDDIDQPDKLLYVSANIIQDFSWMQEKDIKKAPHILFENETYDYGTIKTGTSVKYGFKFKNTGKSVLKILKIKASCGCTTIDENTKKELKKGASSEIIVDFNTIGRVGNQHKTITVITNDPDKPVVVLHLQGNVEK